MLSRILAVLAAVLLAAFFMPWFGPEVGQIPGTTCRGSTPEVSGFAVLRCLVTTTLEATDTAGAFERSFGEAWFFWLLAAIPFFGVLTVFKGIAGATSTSVYAFLAGGVPVGETIYLLVEDGTRLFPYFDVGAWLTLVTGIVLVVLALVPRRG